MNLDIFEMLKNLFQKCFADCILAFDSVLDIHRSPLLVTFEEVFVLNVHNCENQIELTGVGF